MTYNDSINSLVKQLIDAWTTNPTTWTKPWANRTFISTEGHEYQGFNQLLLAAAPYERMVWGTYRQWNSHNCHIPKGSKAMAYIRRMLTFKDKDTDEIRTGGAKPYAVFNIEQVEGDVDQFDSFDSTPELTPLHVRLPSVDTFIDNTNATIIDGSEACYSPRTDQITMPRLEQFISTPNAAPIDHYYATLFHELGHWTGHSDRLNRHHKTSNTLHNKYAFEELVAELTSVFICKKLRVVSIPREDHASYIFHWMEGLKAHPTAIQDAATRASNACDYCFNLQPGYINETERAA